MPAPRSVERRSDGKIFPSTNKAGEEYGRYGDHIARVAQMNTGGKYATAYGEQWRYCTKHPKKWPESSDNKKRRGLVGKAKRVAIAAQIDPSCRAGKPCDPASCPYVKFRDTITALLQHILQPEVSQSE